MTATAQSDKVFINIVPLVSIDMVDISGSNLATRFAGIRPSFFAYFFKPTVSMFKKWGLFSSKVFGETFLRATLPFSFIKSKFVNSEFLRAIKAYTFYTSRRFVSKTILRTIDFIRMFEPRFKVFKNFPASNTSSSFFRDHKSFVGTYFGAKAFLLIFYTIVCYLKRLRTNTTNKINSIFLEIMLAVSRAKKIFMPFNFVRKSIKSFVTVGAVSFHTENCNRSRDCCTATIL